MPTSARTPHHRTSAGTHHPTRTKPIGSSPPLERIRPNASIIVSPYCRDDVGIVPYEHIRTANMVVGRGLAPAAGTGSPECTGHRPPTARRHTQVPPYIPGRTADMVRRAGPMCPAAGTHRKPPNGPICSDRVGRGLAPAAGTGSPECTGHRHPHRTAAHAGAALHSRTDCRHGS